MSLKGILCVDKPRDFTSFDVVAKLRGIAKTRKIGHSGTLDPMATGVLPLFVGPATKACDLLPNHDKRYTATFRLGTVTDTQDITGKVLEEHAVAVGKDQVRRALAGFQGEILQVPPMYSAVKVGGKRLYDLARQGVEVERKPRPVTIYSLTLLQAEQDLGEYTIDVQCSKGTYIRTLCHDIGRQLGCGAVLTGLRRTMACGFALEQCATLEEIAQAAEQSALERLVLPVEAAFSAVPRLDLEEARETRFCNGIRLSLEDLPPLSEGQVAVFGERAGFLGLAYPDRERGLLIAKRIFYRPES